MLISSQITLTHSHVRISTHAHTHTRTYYLYYTQTATTTSWTFAQTIYLFIHPLPPISNRVFQFVPHRPSVDLLLLLAIINSLSPQTVSSRVPLHVRYYLSCAASCGLEGDECGTRCEENNTCEASRQFCKNLCRRAENACFRRCSDEAVEKYHDNE